MDVFRCGLLPECLVGRVTKQTCDTMYSGLYGTRRGQHWSRWSDCRLVKQWRQKFSPSTAADLTINIINKKAVSAGRTSRGYYILYVVEVSNVHFIESNCHVDY